MTRALLILTTAGMLPAGQQPRPMFTSNTDVVVLDVAARVPNLIAADFVVTDNGVRQKVELMDASAMPIDLTVVLDISGSMAALIGPMTKYAEEVVGLMQPGDRVRLITVGNDVRQVFGLSAGAQLPPIEELRTAEMTSLLDGLAAAMMRSRPPDRRQLVVAVTDGMDTMSTLSQQAFEALAARSDSVLFILRPEYAGMMTAVPPRLAADTRKRWAAPFVGFNAAIPSAGEGRLGYVARGTGGEFTRMFARAGGLPRALAEVLDEYRANYVLRYQATGVSREGWHDIAVTLPKHPDAEIRARRGYFAR